MNFKPLIKRVENITSMWYHRGLSLFGRITVLNTLVASVFVYQMTVVKELPQSFYDSLKKIFKEFIWKGKSSKIHWELITALKDEGGAGLIDLRTKEQALKIGWVALLLKDAKFTSLVDDALNNPIKHLLWEVQLSKTDAIERFSVEGFWKNVLTLWYEINFKTMQEIQNVRDQVLWLNSHIKVDGKIVFLPRDVHSWSC